MIRVVRHDDARFAAVAEIVLDRPGKRNALTPAMLEELTARAEELGRDGSCRAVLVRGEGAVFCAGFDLALCRDSPEALAEMLRGLSAAARALRRIDTPVVIAAQGGAIAGGCALLCAADVVVADKGAKFGYPVVLRGISPAVSSPLLRSAVGGRAARERMLDPALVSAEEAKRIGLVDVVVDLPEDVLPRAQIEAARFAAKPRAAMSATKRWLNEVEGSDRDEWFERALEASMALVRRTTEG